MAYFLCNWIFRYALPCRCRPALFIAAVRLAARGGTGIRPGHLRRRCARRRLLRRFPRPDPGGEEIPRAAVTASPGSCFARAITTSTSAVAEGEKISHWIGEISELGIACDGDSLAIGDTLFTVCPWWDGPLVKARIEAQLREAAAKRLGRWIWVHHAPPANSPTSWGGKRFFGDVELVQWIARYQPSMVISGHVHQSPFIPDGSWFDRLGDNLGVQYRPAARPSAGLHRARHRQGHGVLACGRRCALHRPAGAVLRPAAPIVNPPPWLISLGRIADPSLAKPASAAG